MVRVQVRLLFYHHCIEQLKGFEEITSMQVTFRRLDVILLARLIALKKPQTLVSTRYRQDPSKFRGFLSLDYSGTCFFKSLRLCEMVDFVAKIAFWRFLVAWPPTLRVFGLTESTIEIDLVSNTQADLGVQQTR